MAAALGRLPPVAEDEQWAYEMKWDGVRAVGYVSGGRLRLVSRNDKDFTAAYPELTALGEDLGGGDCIIDGEIVALVDGRPSFRALQPRMHQRNPAKIAQLMRSTPVTFLVFDLMFMDGRPLLNRPYTERRELLAELGLSGPHWDTPPHYVSDGAAAVTQSRRLQLEGVMAKRLDSPYKPGKRVPFWVKVKNIRTQEVIIAGWKPGEGRRAGTVGSLMLGIHEGDGLRFVGGVGTGFTEQMLADLAGDLAPLERSEHPFAEEPPRAETRGVHWVEPRLVGEVAYSERTGDGHFRHPSWRGLRPDKEPSQVLWED